MKPTATKVLNELKQHIRPDKAEFLPGFFQAYPGGYGEGDRFLGVVVPDQRKVARQFRDLPLDGIDKLLKSRWHECRLTGIFILVNQFERASKSKLDEDVECAEVIVEFYLERLDRVNNWDLVDSSAHKILGRFLLERRGSRKILHQLASSKHLWRERVSVIANLPLIQDGQFDDFLRLARKFLTHPHDLMHKAVGWMLREMGKQDILSLRVFLNQHSNKMPRTMLRYAIEKLPKTERDQWLGKA